MRCGQGGDVNKTVLVFDSGVGGLSVYQEIRALLPELRFIYAFDNAKFPYGELAADELVSRCCSVIAAVMARHAVDLVVVACNTASTQVLPTLRHMLTIPVVGVVPAIKPAAAASHKQCIGLLATPATVQRSYTDELIQTFAAGTQVLRCGSTELVIQAERKLAGFVVEQEVIERILRPWREEEPVPDVIVLGCTHFPLLKEEIEAVLPGVRQVDSGSAIARRVKQLVGGSVSVSRQSSMAYCTRKDETAELLIPALQQRGLEVLLELDLQAVPAPLSLT